MAKYLLPFFLLLIGLIVWPLTIAARHGEQTPLALLTMTPSPTHVACFSPTPLSQLNPGELTPTTTTTPTPTPCLATITPTPSPCLEPTLPPTLTPFPPLVANITTTPCPDTPTPIPTDTATPCPTYTPPPPGVTPPPNPCLPTPPPTDTATPCPTNTPPAGGTPPPTPCIPTPSVTPSATPYFSATVLVSTQPTAVSVGDSISVTVDLLVSEGCQLPVYELTVRQLTSESPIIEPAEIIIGPSDVSIPKSLQSRPSALAPPPFRPKFLANGIVRIIGIGLPCLVKRPH